ncbi:MAG: hypothetical protein CME06_17535 [Gemmatimonadetes bacterium]|nr:hypothetical protein [Gemmatimonadota bacterium]
MATISLIMPTYQRDFIIPLAVGSIVNQREHSSRLELLIGDDGSDGTEEAIGAVDNTNPLLSIQYIRLGRMPLSDKRNLLVRRSTGDYFGVVDSDDIQSPYKIAALERAMEEHADANMFGQREFLYHDIVTGRTVRWRQNRDMGSFKAGSFVVLSRAFWEEAGGYPEGLWRSVDSAFSEKIEAAARRLRDLGEIDSRLPETTVALQHVSNIWRRKSKGLDRRGRRQLANYVATPVELELGAILGPNAAAFMAREQSIRSLFYRGSRNPLDRLRYRRMKRLGVPNVVAVERSAEYYESKYRDGEHHETEHYAPVYEQVLKFLGDCVAPEGRILEIGCGRGELAAMIREAGFRGYRGIDISASAVDVARGRMPDWRSRFSTGSAYDPADLGEEYDVAIAVEVLEHLDDLRLLRQLRPGSWIIASVPNYWSSNNEHLRVYRSRWGIRRRFRLFLTDFRWFKVRTARKRRIRVFRAMVRDG